MKFRVSADLPITASWLVERDSAAFRSLLEKV